MEIQRVPILKSGFGMGGVIARTLPDHGRTETLVPRSLSGDEKWMALALLEAMNANGWSSPNPAVGCVLVHDEKKVAAGFTQSFGGMHAERMAFESIGSSLETLKDVVAYVTLEPCSHFGKQPPCVDLLLHPSIQKVVIGCEDPNPRVAGEGIRKLLSAGKKVEVGILKEEVQAWHLPFLHFQKTRKPLWVAKWAESLDGVLADSSGNSKWITNESSRAYTHWLRQKYDAILVGAGTWIQDQPLLTVRDCAKPHHRHPVILIHDPRKKIKDLESRSRIHVYHQESMAETMEAIEKTDFGFELQSVFCEGGPRTLDEIFKTGQVDVVHRFVGHRLMGASKYKIHHFEPEGAGSPWRLASNFNFGNDLLQEWVK